MDDDDDSVDEKEESFVAEFKAMFTWRVRARVASVHCKCLMMMKMMMQCNELSASLFVFVHYYIALLNAL